MQRGRLLLSVRARSKHGEDRVKRPTDRLADLIEGSGAWVLVITAVLLAGALYLARDLRVDQNFQRLLPGDAPSVQRIAQLDARLGNQSDLVVAIRSPDRDANIRFGKALAAELGKRSDLRYVLFHNEQAFFEDHALLFASLPDLLDLRQRVKDRIRSSVRKNTIVDFDDTPPGDSEEEDDELSKDSIRERYGLNDDFKEFMEARDGTVFVLKARPKRSSSDLEFARTVYAGVQDAVKALKPADFHPEMTATVEGSYAEHTQRAEAMQSSVVEGSLAALFILLLSIALWFRSLRAVLWVLTPLLASAVLALGFAQVVYGHLNIVSAFIFAVLLGLGIDFGVHILARYRDERNGGLEPGPALRETLATTGMSTAAGAISTAGCFVVLVGSSFQGFAQFGVVGAVGIALALIAALVVMPALMWRTGRASHLGKPRAVSQGGYTGGVPWLALGIVAVGLGLAGLGAVQASEIGFEYDLSKLGPEKREKKAKTLTAEDDDWREAVGKGGGTAPAVALTGSLEETDAVHRQLQALLELKAPAEVATAEPELEADDEDDDPFGDDDDEDPFVAPEPAELVRIRKLALEPEALTPATKALLATYDAERHEKMKRRIRRVVSIADFVPIRQTPKLWLIADIKERIDNKREALHDDDKAELEEWYRYLTPTREIGPNDLPDWVKVQMTDLDGNLGRFVIFWTNGRKANYLDSAEIRDAFFNIAVAAGETVPTAADFYVLPAILDSIADDGPRVTWLALLVLFLSSLWLFRGLHGPLVVLPIVGAALCWLLAIMAAMGWKADLFNLIAVPLLIGMGMDDTLHLYHRYQEGSGPGRLREALVKTGPAIALTTWTTAVGFAGIFFANHRGLLSLARVAVVGIVLCLISSAVLLPAALRVKEWLTQSGRPAP